MPPCWPAQRRARYEPELVAGRAARVWARSAETVAAQIHGPHFEDLARRWCLEHAAEAKAASAPVEARELRRLEHLRGLLPSARVEQPPKLLLFGRGGFSAELAAEAAARPDVELVDLARLYRGRERQR
jgi:hypothetical protein